MRGFNHGALAAGAGALLLVSGAGCGHNGETGFNGAPRAHAMAAGAREHRAVSFTRSGDAREGSTVVLARLSGRDVAVVADEDDAELRTIDLRSHEETSRTKLPGVPGQMVIAKDGRLFVAIRETGLLAVYRATDDRESTFHEVALVPTADEPIGLALTPDDRTLLVACGAGRRVQGFAVDGYARGIDVPVAREPRAVVVSDDGSRAFVSHIAGGTMSVVDLSSPRDSGEIALRGIQEELDIPQLLVDIEPLVMSPPLPSPAGAVGGPSPARAFINFAVPEPNVEQSLGTRSAAQGFALAKVHVGKRERILGPEVMVSSGLPTVRTEGYGGGAFASAAAEVAEVAVVDEQTLSAEPLSLHVGGEGFDLRRQGAAACILPRAAAADDAHAALYVACAGADAIVEYDASSANPSNAERRRWKIGAGPTGMALDTRGHRLVVWSQFEHALGVLPLGERGAEVTEIALGDSREPAPRTLDVLERDSLPVDVSLGRRLFFGEGDPRISSDGRACASCHPDGRDDGNVWSTPDGPRQTPMLAGRLRGTAPYGWYGTSDTVAKHIETNSLHRLGGTGLPPRDLAALAAYVTSLRGPMRAPGRSLDPREARGREIFLSAEAGCSSCHVEGDGSFTDGDRHDVKSGVAADVVPSFDTPSLRFVDDSAPYFHDGRYADLHDLLVKSDGKMGHTAQLSPDDLSALEAYLRTI